MKLSIVNYGTSAKVQVPSYAKREDDAILAIAKDIVVNQGMGKGAMIVSEVMHTGLRNQNFREYAAKGMDVACRTFYEPHFTPFLMHHEMGGGGLLGGGDPKLVSVGTNLIAQFTKKTVETPVGTANGYVKVGTFISEASKIGDLRAIDAIQARQLMTLSIGARVSDEDYTCSVCGLSRYDDECEHTLGKEYDGKICFVNVRNPFFREYSAVYNPSDINAVIRRMDVEESANGRPVEEHCVDMLQVPSQLNIYEVSGSKVYPSAAIPTKETDMSKPNQTTETAPEPQSTESADVTKPYQDKIQALESTIKDLEGTIKTKDATIAVLSLSLKEKIDALNALIATTEENDEEEETPPAAPQTSAAPAESAPAVEDQNPPASTQPEESAPAASTGPVADPAPAKPESNEESTEVPGSTEPQESTPESTEPAPAPESTPVSSTQPEVPTAGLRDLMLSGSLSVLGNAAALKRSGIRHEGTATRKEGAPFQFKSLREVIRDK